MKIRDLLLILGVLALFGEGLAGQTVLNPLPYKIVGQFATPSNLDDTLAPTQVTPNLVEGRELFRPQSIAVDTSLDPPALWVADTANNRVLGYRDARSANGAPMADIVLGQRDFRSNTPLALTAFPASLNGPTAIAVDADGNVFVADAGNNRILRFPRPFDRLSNGTTVFQPDLVIGQRTLTANLPNQSSTTNAPPTEFTLRTAVPSGTARVIYNVDLVFDKGGNLWFTDAANNRILRYPAAAVSGPGNVAGGEGTQIAADFCVAQLDFNRNVVNPGRTTVDADRLDKTRIRFPSALAFDDSGNLYVIDDLARVLVYPAGENGIQPFTTAARRIMGIIVAGQVDPPSGLFNNTAFGPEFNDAGTLYTGGPRGLMTINNRIYVIDSLFHRILRFPPYEEWPVEAVRFSPAAEAVFGQDDFTTANPNRYLFSEPNASTMFAPIHAVFADGKVWLADSQNNRIVVFPSLAEIPNEQAPTAQAERFVGQLSWEFRAPNLVEGREFSTGGVSFVAPGGAATLTVFPSAVVDTTTSGETRVYIADPGNNRILAYGDYYRMKAGDRADFVLGQVDFFRVLPNSPLMNPNGPTREGMVSPGGVAVDKAGNLYIADTGNRRVLRYPKPFEKWRNGEPQLPDLVIGQDGFEARDKPLGAGFLFAPTALTVTETGKLAVLDPLLNRVMVFQPSGIADGTPVFTNGQDALFVLGQSDFSGIGSGSGIDQLNLPLSIAADIDSRIYVADSGNNRVVIFPSLEGLTPGGGAIGALFLSLGTNSTISSIAVSRPTGKIFIGDIGTLRASGSSWTGQRVVRFPDYWTLALTGSTAQETQVAAFGPRNITLDPLDNPMVFDTANRATFHYPLHAVSNWASESPRIAPNLIANLRAPGVTFSREAVEDKTTPWKKALADVEVLVNGTPAPITRSQLDTVRIMVPRDAPATGRADFLVRRASTGQILAQNTVQMVGESPALIPLSVPGGGLVRALNQDGSENSTTSRAAAGQEVTLFLVGYGAIPNAPPDGTAPGSALPVEGRITVALGNLTDAISSTLDPEEPGVWRVKAKIPDAQVCPSNGQLPVAIAWRDVPSRIGPTGGATLTTSLYCRN